MKQLISLILLLTYVSALTCNIYDFSQPKVSCVQSCPPGTDLINSYCLTSSQYIQNSQVYQCSGYVSADHTVCCSQKQYIQEGQCLTCHGQIFNNGISCCSSDSYLDYSQAVPNCIPLTTGACPTLTLISPFKLCCPSGRMFSISGNQCVNSGGMNCDASHKVCCPIGQYLQYSQGQYFCVQRCSWTISPNSGLICQQKECGRLNSTMLSGPGGSGSWQLMSFSQNCCVGLSSGSVCQKSNATCLTIFANQGFSICCQAGWLYSAATQKCVSDCVGGTVVFNAVCISTFMALDLTGSLPAQVGASSNCNGATINPNLPICCPYGFFIQDNTGCQLCNGNVFTVVGYQICCKTKQYFNSTTRTCVNCEGNTDAGGQICCGAGQYVAYNINGNPSCASNCDLGSLYKGRYCCQGMAQGCSSTLVPTSCNPAYYNLQSCGGCPGFCGTNQLCGTSQQSICTMSCGFNQIYYTGVGCLQCDASCNGCTRPLDPTQCISCGFGYTFVQSSCQICAQNCLTCRQFTDFCTSCLKGYILIKNKCYIGCSQGYYFDAARLTCRICSSSCQTCSTSASNCTMCPYTTFVRSGSCSLCDYSCATCFGSSSSCLQCTTGYYKNSDGSCTMQCFGIIVDQYVNGARCLPCHPDCNGCTVQPQNCYLCNSNTTFLDSSLGINVCTPCQPPCVTCSSLTACTSCGDGFYRSGTVCSKCEVSCLTCSGPSKTNCLSCFGNSKLISSGACSGCSAGCNVCSGATCKQCVSDYILYLGICITSCPAQTYFDGSTCQNCDVSCSQCNATNCSQCANGYFYTLGNLCYLTCPNNYSPSGNLCIANKPTPPKNDSSNNKNNTNNNNTKNNSNSNNNSNNNSSKNGSTVLSGPMLDQTIVISGNQVYVNVYLPNQNVLDVNVSVSLVNAQTGQSILLIPSSSIDKSPNAISFSAHLPFSDLSGYQLLETNAVGPNINSTLLSSQPASQLIASSYLDNVMSNMRVFGYVFSPIMLLFVVLAKIKGHFSAQQATNIVLHVFNWGQVCYLFKFASPLDNAGYFFLNGFGMTHLTFFPNFFAGLISPYYVQTDIQKTLVPDGNLIRNAGNTFSYQLVVLGVTVLAVAASVCYSKLNQLDELVHFRKIMRLGILLMAIGFMNELFFAFVQVVQPSSCLPFYQSFYNGSVACSYILIFFVPALMAGVLYHYYKTYNSDVLEHYYTLREGSLFLSIYGQAIIMCLSVGKPLMGLFLIPLQAIWFIFNFLLYRYGAGMTLGNFKKYFVVSGVICFSYIFLSLQGQINWLPLVIVVSFAAIVLIVYCGYQLVGIYYFKIFSGQAKEQHQS